MAEDWKQTLFALVRAELGRHGPRVGRRRVWSSIEAAHNGRPDGYFITYDNQHLFRCYRNNVSCNPGDLISDALKSQKEEAVQ